MKKIILCLLLAPFMAAATPPTGKAALKAKHKKECIDKITRGEKDAKKIAAMKEYCSCSTSIIVDNMSEKDLEKMYGG